MRQTIAALRKLAYHSTLSATGRVAAAGLIALSMTAGAGAKPPSVDPRYAAIVVDAKSGKTLYSVNAAARRFPASLTKMMTLYLTFEAMKAGKIDKATPISFSVNASSKPPTKLGIRPGGSVTVETAVLALVTKSANDAATALGEYLGGSENGFARKMTAKARALGMSGTVFQNPSGLPDPGQFTSARDMATLGLALRRDFPQYYAYFSTPSFTYGRQRMANHNRLLGRIKGVDGIKTGYTRISGYNLVSSVSDGNRRIVAVVMGGSSGASRDNQMAALIQQYLPLASYGGNREPLIAAADIAPDAVQPATVPRQKPVLDGQPHVQDADGSFNADVGPAPAPAPVKVAGRKAAKADAGAKVDAKAANAAVEQAFAEPAARPAANLTKRKGSAEQAIDTIKTSSVVEPKGWVVQVASSPSQKEALTALLNIGRKVDMFADANGYTVPFAKDGVTYYRARFGGFGSKTKAFDACQSAKKQKFACYAIQN